MNKKTTTISCFHCGLPVDEKLDIFVKYENENKPMCCYGCQAVSQAIIDSGMDQFYQYRTSTPEKPDVIVPTFLQQLKAYDSTAVQNKFVRHTDSKDTLEVSLILEGITCAACIWLNEKHLNALDGVISANINYSNHRARVRWDNSRIQLSDILESISRIGYMAHPYDPEQHQRVFEKERKQQIKRLGVSGLLGMQVMIFAVAMYTGNWWGMEETFRQSFRWISLALTTPILLYASIVFFKSAFRDLSHRRVGMDVPISLGIAIAFTASLINTIQGSGEVYFDSVAMFTFFLLSARFFEMGTRKQTSETTEALLNLKPVIATRLINYENKQSSTIENQESIAVVDLCPADYLLVRPGEIIPADGIIVEGISGINESLITGESLPVTKQLNDEVIGGSSNTENPLIIRITKIGEDSILSSIQRLIDEAQHTKPAIAKLADRVASWFVSILLSIAAIVAYYWYTVDASQWLEITIATLVVSCPCALSLATPTAITAASGQLAKIGLLPKRAHALETLAHATDFVFDKTGTLTTGKIKLESILLNNNTYEKEYVLNIAASLEANSEHPIAKALLAANKQPLINVDKLKHTTGSGIQASVTLTDKTNEWFIGNQSFIEQATSIKLNIDSKHANKIFLATNSSCVATFVLSDSLREESYSLIKKLQLHNKNTHLMSGDNNENTKNISQQLHIQSCEANLKPENKLQRVKDLQQQGAIVVMTGDGVNDAPVLAGANLSIAMGKGTQLAAATADMILISNNIENIYNGYLIAIKTLRIIKQNLSWALLYNITAIPAAAMGYVEPWLAAIGMSVSSLVVVLNALRLNRMKH
ncbi:Type cbb3 cytochrome oxidase biogenesis protein CcoI; Copper-translocating P-type ATPase [hydrothermal vent metagenome]|uniref:Type cbb3 cytochrome oxidase biogenesis protein CcoI Copper-translocating P-type ATPase n=1 Tax=hydrothermal vent metagenome TaxID=652676 RepID=A0A3B0WMM6_9ZZZZ